MEVAFTDRADVAQFGRGPHMIVGTRWAAADARCTCGARRSGGEHASLCPVSLAEFRNGHPQVVTLSIEGHSEHEFSGAALKLASVAVTV